MTKLLIENKYYHRKNWGSVLYLVESARNKRNIM